MNNERLVFCEITRILIAKELEIPPDDIDMKTILMCCERAIRDSSENGRKEKIITLKTTKEEFAMLNSYGPQIVKRVFEGDSPFFDWAFDYEESYIKLLSEKLNDEN